ncbi:Cysteine-rich RLK (RECEPTOR-like protein kinase) 14, putative isoform 1 [Hibiscus syriacus]|uniref:Cysteine-rich RLK (RECEPTOR-like protein kinase) 14, putative isoform 1 n=1 Tax=Hibiscus syriacus TaxID=106335 RepID=A0A6A3CB84_HIBSY|nr:Cysteine-rich RLK (RECEPTOR-like protein kinase) 14, putative isoform 1 [Hibiscus syriacus]
MWVKLKAASSILSYLVIGIGLVAAVPTRCYDTGNFTTNSTYGNNRDLLLDSLPRNASANGGFITATIGQGSDKVYALAMCKGDSTPDECFSVVNYTIHELMDTCPNQKEAYSWAGDFCIVHYADHIFFGTPDLEPSWEVYNTGNITSNLTEFDTVWESLINSVVSKASKGSSSLKYATGEADVTVFEKIYSLMQCTPDLSEQRCDYCLRQSASRYESCCHGKQGGVVWRTNCYFRWDLYPFYTANASTTVSLSPPPSPSSPPPQSVNSEIRKEGGGISSRTLVIIIVPSVTFIVVLVILGIVVLPMRIKKKKQNDQNNKMHVESLQIDFHAVRAATENFSDANMLGRGGFGPVYKVI